LLGMAVEGYLNSNWFSSSSMMIEPTRLFTLHMHETVDMCIACDYLYNCQCVDDIILYNYI